MIICTDSGSEDESDGIEFTGECSELRKLLECSVCYDMILPPITLCSSGHSVCNRCREKLQNCPVCRSKFTKLRNLFAEKFLGICTITCKYKKSGCKTILSGWELFAHQTRCDFRCLLCPQCAQEIPYEQFLYHLSSKEELEMGKGEMVMTGFQIEQDDVPSYVWEPIWIHCHDRDFFCFLNKIDSIWLIWVGVFGPCNVCKGFVTSITIWNEDNQAKIKFVGDVHPLRSTLENVRDSEQCIILEDSSLDNYLREGGFDICVRIDREFNVPKEDRNIS